MSESAAPRWNAVGSDLAARAIVLDSSQPGEIERLLESVRSLVVVPHLPHSYRPILEDALQHLLAARTADEEARSKHIEAAAAALAQLPDQPTDEHATPTADDSAAALPPSPNELSAQEPELVRAFIDESRENLADAESGLLALEKHPGDKEAIGRVFRAFHTIKGVSGFLGLQSIELFSHAAESLFARVRSGEVRCVGRNATLALRSVDALRACLDRVETALRENAALVAPEGLDRLIEALGDPELPDGPTSTLAVEVMAPKSTNMIDDDTFATSPRKAKTEAEAGWMRVRTDRLDRLIDMVGELVIAQSMVSQDPVMISPSHEEFRKKVAHGAKIVRELQELGMALRMVPLKPTFQRLLRLVRDVVSRTGKDVAFETDGEETEIDRNMVDVISDPLVHMVRNAIDHGIESEERRRAAGKPLQGTVRIAASHAGGSLVIRLSDDGGGLDRRVIAAKAIERGLITSDQGMSDDEVLALIFEAGFSTRDAVSDLSGRGVGMDVVKRGVEALKGRIETSSVVGKGTTFTIRVPLTLAITDGMLVRVGSERFIIPTVAVRTSFRPTREALSTVAGRGEFVRIRDEFLALFRLHRIFDIPDAEVDPTRALIVIVDYGEGRSAFLVDDLLAQQQVVSKALTNHLLTVKGVAGGAILGDGRVGLILDPPGLVELAHQTPSFVSAA